MTPAVVDVSRLPQFGFHHRSLLWWGTMAMIAIEGTVFALTIMSYLYLKGRTPQWPPSHFPPYAFWGTVNTVVLLLSALPNQLAKRAAERLDLRGIWLWMGIALAFGVAFNIIRIFEFQSLNVWWDENAYGSVVWLLLGLHTTHTLTDVIDTAVLYVLMIVGPIGESRFVDVSENALYWWFVVLSWLPIYAVIYFVPRFW
jgi:heme/copper-type cytochrome/quinol oxidase subunit 3